MEIKSHEFWCSSEVPFPEPLFICELRPLLPLRITSIAIRRFFRGKAIANQNLLIPIQNLQLKIRQASNHFIILSK